jgi:transposase InsO family protein
LPEFQAVAQVSERYGVGASTVRRWSRLKRQKGKRGLLPRYQYPGLDCGDKSLPFFVQQLIVALRGLLGWCGQRIAAELARRGIYRLSHMRVYRFFQRHHIRVRTYHPVGKKAGIRYRRQRTRAPNEVWHLDWAGPYTDRDGVKRSLLVAVDAYSRMLLCVEVVQQQSFKAAKKALEQLFETYGKPRIIITDNGRAFVPSVEGWAHQFGQFLEGRQIQHRRTRLYYPQTNGKAEAAIKTVQRECLRLFGWAKGSTDWAWKEILLNLPAFKGWYNFYRPHGAIGYQNPAQLFANVQLQPQGIDNIFGFLPESVVDPEKLPQLNQQIIKRNFALAAAQ